MDEEELALEEGKEMFTEECNEKSTESNENKKVTAKKASLWGQIFAAIWVAGWSAFKFIKTPAEMTDVIVSGLAIAACFSPVYFNLLLDKIKEIKWGK